MYILYLICSYAVRHFNRVIFYCNNYVMNNIFYFTNEIAFMLILFNNLLCFLCTKYMFINFFRRFCFVLFIICRTYASHK